MRVNVDMYVKCILYVCMIVLCILFYNVYRRSKYDYNNNNNILNSQSESLLRGV